MYEQPGFLFRLTTIRHCPPDFDTSVVARNVIEELEHRSISGTNSFVTIRRRNTMYIYAYHRKTRAQYQSVTKQK